MVTAGSTAPVLSIGSFKVGHGQPCLVIAEAGVNHNGRLDLAKQLVDAAVAAGADAVKFQTFKAERLSTRSAPKAEYQRVATDAQDTQLSMLEQLELSDDALRELFSYCRQKEILFLSSPFDEESADFLAALGVAAYKIPSGEVTNPPFLTHIAGMNKPIILSTGMASLGEVESAVHAVFQAGNHELALLHCVSRYPADAADSNLRAMHTLAYAFQVPVGYSDHTLGISVALAAVALGASIIEKHFSLDRTLPGPDHKASLEPAELAELVKGVRTVECALGHGRKEPVACEHETALVVRKSLVARSAIPAGTVITTEMVALKRPGTGLPPHILPLVTGRRAIRDIEPDTLISLEMLA